MDGKQLENLLLLKLRGERKDLSTYPPPLPDWVKHRGLYLTGTVPKGRCRACHIGRDTSAFYVCAETQQEKKTISQTSHTEAEKEKTKKTRKRIPTFVFLQESRAKQ
jgi:hypothetical protein